MNATIEKLSADSPIIVDLLNRLTSLEAAKHAAKGYQHPADKWHAKEGRKFINLDCGHSGAFMLEKDTGELFNIKGYGVPDRNKKSKANIGNVFSVDVDLLWHKRFNYLR